MPEVTHSLQQVPLTHKQASYFTRLTCGRNNWEEWSVWLGKSNHQVFLFSWCYLGKLGNPPKHWEEYPLLGAHVHKACPSDTWAGEAAAQIYLCNQTEPAASPNPAVESPAFLPVNAATFITHTHNDFRTTKMREKKQHNKSIHLDVYVFMQAQGLR